MKKGWENVGLPGWMPKIKDPGRPSLQGPSDAFGLEIWMLRRKEVLLAQKKSAEGMPLFTRWSYKKESV